MSQLLIGDCRETLKTLPDASIQCCVTSPPYFGLRDYGTASWDGGDPACDHADPGARDPKERGTSTLGGGVATIAAQSAGARARNACRKCGALRVDLQIGLEKTPDAYVAELVQVFREVKRVLKDDGTLWLNLGDSYAANRALQVTPTKWPTLVQGQSSRVPAGLKPKDLIGIPWRVAFALQADGWYLRQDIIWAKPNPMPESVWDRCTRAHEYLFMLTKAERYFYDYDAIREPLAASSISRLSQLTYDQQQGSTRQPYTQNAKKAMRPRSSGNVERKIAAEGERQRTNSHLGSSVPWEDDGTGRNRRSVWTITTKPFKGAHFAVMPEALVEPCVLAGTKPGDMVLDPFLGSGTVARVAQRLGRDWIGCELNPEYASLIHERTEQTAVAL